METIIFKYFDLEKLGTTIQQEITAGFVLYPLLKVLNRKRARCLPACG
jgi:xanthine/uracil/vitamin C permease (AzgA family)